MNFIENYRVLIVFDAFKTILFSTSRNYHPDSHTAQTGDSVSALPTRGMPLLLRTKPQRWIQPYLKQLCPKLCPKSPACRPWINGFRNNHIHRGGPALHHPHLWGTWHKNLCNYFSRFAWLLHFFDREPERSATRATIDQQSTKGSNCSK